MLVVCMRSVAHFGGMFLLPIFLQNLMGFDEIQSGLIMLPGAMVIGLFMPFSGNLRDRFGPRWPTIAGLVGIVVFMYMYRTLDVNTTVSGDVIFSDSWFGVGDRPLDRARHGGGPDRGFPSTARAWGRPS